MTIAEMKKLQREAELAIQHAIASFEQATGVELSSLDIDRQRVIGGGYVPPRVRTAIVIVGDRS